MSSVYTYMVITSGLIILLTLGGLLKTDSNSFSSWYGVDINNPSAISSGSFFGKLLNQNSGIFFLGALAGIVVGFFTNSKPETFIVGAIAAGLLTTTTSAFVSILSIVKQEGFVYYLVFLIFIPLLLGYAISLIRFWRGND